MIDIDGRLISGIGLPDEDSNGIPDVLDVKLEDDTKTVPAGSIVTIDLVENDAEDVDPKSIVFIKPIDDNIISRLSIDGKILVIDGEGTWTIDDNGTATFTPESSFEGKPTPIGYEASNIYGTKTARAKIEIFVTAVAGVTDENCGCDTYVDESVSSLGMYGLMLMLMLGSIFGVSFLHRER